MVTQIFAAFGALDIVRFDQHDIMEFQLQASHQYLARLMDRWVPVGIIPTNLYFAVRRKN